jgi:response regulator RpfG family c-di-GMP phosphodiesterase
VPPSPAKSKTVCDVLVRERLLRPDIVDSVLGRAQRTGERVEEVVLELGLAGETEMLKALATHYKVYFISSEKLAKAEVGRAVVDMIPQRFAEKIGVCPVMFDAKTLTLSVATADPEDYEALREAQLASGARDVKGIYARPSAVKALIAKWYLGDTRAFALLERQAHAQQHSMMRGYADGIDLSVSEDDPPVIATPPPRAEPKREAPPPPRPPPPLPAKAQSVAAPPVPPPPPPTAVPAPSDGKKVSDASFVELLHVLVSLLENTRAELRGHSAEVARLVRRVGEKVGLDSGRCAMLVVSALIHDLGKMGQYHLTTLNCSEYDGHKNAAQKAWGLPARLLEPVHLPAEAIQIASRMYERYDGKGFPDGLGGKDIPLGTRILAICDTYADLTSNPRNPYRKTLVAQEACVAIAKHKETIFDPNLVDVFRNTVLGEEIAARLLNRAQALLVDADPEETTVLELRMVEQGFVVKTARSVEQALKVLAEGTTDLVVSEIDLGVGDGLALIAEARKQPWGKDLPWVVYTRRQERLVAQKAFDMGVLDYVTKPASADLLVAKLKALLEQRATASPRTTQGVSGSLREMGLPDMVQVLFHGRKTGKLQIRAQSGSGEIHFDAGNVVDALWNDARAEAAFYAMLKLTDGDFALDPSFRPTGRAINQSAEALLLEGMRRMDEGLS